MLVRMRIRVSNLELQVCRARRAHLWLLLPRGACRECQAAPAAGGHNSLHTLTFTRPSTTIHRPTDSHQPACCTSPLAHLCHPRQPPPCQTRSRRLHRAGQAASPRPYCVRAKWEHHGSITALKVSHTYLGRALHRAQRVELRHLRRRRRKPGGGARGGGGLLLHPRRGHDSNHRSRGGGAGG